MSGKPIEYLARHLNSRYVGIESAQLLESPAVVARAAIDASSAQLQSKVTNLTREFAQFRHELPDALIEVDIETMRFVFLNRAARNLLGYGDHHFRRGLASEDVFDETSRGPSLRTGRTRGAQNPTLCYEIDVVCSDETRVRVELRGSLVRDVSGRPVKVRAILREVALPKVLPQIRRIQGRLAPQASMPAPQLPAGGHLPQVRRMAERMSPLASPTRGQSARAGIPEMPLRAAG